MKKVTEVNLGMVKDITDEKEASPNTVVFALNSVSSTEDGDNRARSNEGGNTFRFQVPVGYRYVGQIPIGADEMILFSTNVTNMEIGSVVNGIYTAILNFSNTEFNFKPEHPIRGWGRIRQGNEKIVYINDKYNPDRVINLSRLDLYNDSLGNFTPALTLFRPPVVIPNVELTEEFDGGGLMELGSYRIALRYVSRDGNETETFFVSNSFTVVRGQYSGLRRFISGGYNRLSGNFPLASDAYGKVAKSYKFQFSGLDTNYTALKIYVLKYSDGDGVTFSGWLVDELSLNGDTSLTWTFSGINEVENPTVTIDQLLLELARYDTCAFMLMTQSRLLRANLREKFYDWAKFQKYASQVKVKYVVGSIPIEDRSRNTDVYPNGTYEFKTLFRNEVVAIGYAVVFKNGLVSPVFHVPGRPAIDTFYVVNTHPYTNPLSSQRNSRNGYEHTGIWDRKLYTVIPDGAFLAAEQVHLRNVKHLGLIVGDTVEYWKVFNTAIPDYTYNLSTGQKFRDPWTEFDFWSSGLPGFYEVTDTYPIVLDGDGDMVYPHDIVAGNIVPHKIRHHRMPDTALDPIATGDGYSYPHGDPSISDTVTYPLGIRLFDVDFPPEYVSEIAGIKLYIADRTGNKTVISKSYADTPTTATVLSGFTPVEYYLNKIVGRTASPGAGFFTVGVTCQSPSIALNVSENYPGTYLCIESRIENKLVQWINDTAGIAPFRLGFYTSHRRFGKLPDTAEYNNLLLGYGYSPFNTRISTGISRTGSNLLPPTLPITYGSVPGADGSIRSGFQRELCYIVDYRLATLPNFTATTNPNLAPGTEIAQYALYVATMSTQDVYSNLRSILYIPVSDKAQPISTSYTGFGTHGFITECYFLSTLGDQPGAANTRWFHNGFIQYYCESEINWRLRNEGAETYQKVYPFTEVEDAGDSGIKYFLDTAKYHSLVIKENFNSYNYDYSASESVRRKTTFDHTLNYQTGLGGLFPVRIAWSDRSFDEELGNRNRQFFALDYVDIATDSGEINLLVEHRNLLYAITNSSIYYKPTNDQSISFDGAVAFLKTGEFLDIPETELVANNIGFGGSQSRIAVTNSAIGTVYLNQRLGQVYLIKADGGFAILSDSGFTRWFQENSRSYIATLFEDITGLPYPLSDSPNAVNGVGFVLVYDPLYKRVLITKRDYQLLVNFGGLLPANPLLWNEGWIYYTHILGSDTLSFHKITGGIANFCNVEDGDETVWRIRSWTLSYSIKDEAWWSFHSYLPATCFSDSITLYTSPKGSHQFFRHLLYNRTTFYSKKYPYIVEFKIVNPERAFIDELNWVTTAKQQDFNTEVSRHLHNITFNKVIVYSHENSTGLLTLTVPTTIWDNVNSWTPGNRFITRFNNVWKVNGLFDLRTNDTETSAVTADWTYPDYNTYFEFLPIERGYIESVPNLAVIDYTKSQFAYKRIDNSPVIVRLYFEKVEDVLLVVQAIVAVKTLDLK